MEEDTKGDENLLSIPEIADLPTSPALAVGSIALNMAMKYHDITTVQDGTLYQQFKMEGKNLQGLHLDMVFDTAKRIEIHLMTTSNRLSDVVYGTMIEAVAALSDDDEGEGE